MRVLIFLMVLTSCASNNNNKLVDESYDLNPKSLKAKKAHVHEMLGKHNELDSATKDKIEKIIIFWI